MRVSFCVICHFPLVVLNILSSSLIFVYLITMYLSMFLLVFILPGALCFLDLADCFISHVKEVFSYYLFQYFLTYSLSFLLLWQAVLTVVAHLDMCLFPQTDFLDMELWITQQDSWDNSLNILMGFLWVRDLLSCLSGLGMDENPEGLTGDLKSASAAWQFPGPPVLWLLLFQRRVPCWLLCIVCVLFWGYAWSIVAETLVSD